jgi:hypothetical protein
MMNTIKRLAAVTAAAGATFAVAPAAFAAVPTVSTGGSSKVTASSARLHASVNPRGRPTSYYFEYGTTRRYGSRTGDASAGSSSKGRTVTADVGGLKPNTTYHYRIVASNPDGVASGGDRNFKTRKQPLGLALNATPNPVVFGAGTTVAGQLTGTGNGGQQIVLQQRAFPFTSGFANVGNAIVTDANGNFAFPALALPATTQVRAQTSDKKVTSAVATVTVAVKVSTTVRTRVKRGRLLRFSGSIRPGRDGAQYAVQKLGRSGQWVTVAGGITRKGGQGFSTYSRRIRVRRGGQYRVFVRIVDGNYTSGIGRTVTLRTHR